MTNDVLIISLPKEKFIRAGKESVPLASLYLSEYLNKNNISCEYIDFSVPKNINNDITESLVNKFKNGIPKLLCINCFSSYQFPMVITIAHNIKSFYPDLLICIGGSHPTFFPEEILKNCSYIDYIIIGEGEESLLSLSNFVINKSVSLKDIQSLCYRNGKNIITNPRKTYLQNLDINPRKLWESFKFEDYYSDHSLWNNPKRQNIRLAVPIISSRSCPFNCIFCSASKIMGRTIRYRIPENVLDEIEYLNKERGQNYFEFVDDNINVNRNHVIQIFQGIIDRRLDIQISLASGIHLASADEKLIRIMAKAGLVMIKMPIEHGNDYIRNKIIGKNLKREDIFKISKILKEYNVFIFGLFIMGFPEDTPQTLDDSYNLMYELKLDMYEMASLIPFPSTKLFKQCVRDNLLVSELDHKDIWKGIISFDASEHDKIYIKPYNMTIEELKEYREKFNKIRIFSDKAKGIK
jgi:anaerobic magnesium-protoporphyrin IX monomethyl ester cyclase